MKQPIDVDLWRLIPSPGPAQCVGDMATTAQMEAQWVGFVVVGVTGGVAPAGQFNVHEAVFGLASVKLDQGGRLIQVEPADEGAGGVIVEPGVEFLDPAHQVRRAITAEWPQPVPGGVHQK